MGKTAKSAVKCEVSLCEKEAVKPGHEVKTVRLCVSWSVIRNSSVLPFPTHNALPGTQFSITSYAIKPEAPTN